MPESPVQLDWYMKAHGRGLVHVDRCCCIEIAPTSRLSKDETRRSLLPVAVSGHSLLLVLTLALTLALTRRLLCRGLRRKHRWYTRAVTSNGRGAELPPGSWAHRPCHAARQTGRSPQALRPLSWEALSRVEIARWLGGVRDQTVRRSLPDGAALLGCALAWPVHLCRCLGEVGLKERWVNCRPAPGCSRQH